MENLEPVLNALCNYHAGIALDEEEGKTLQLWLAESAKHRKLFTELGSGLRWVMGEIESNPRERIQKRLIELDDPTV
jgi:hypothetical protein